MVFDKISKDNKLGTIFQNKIFYILKQKVEFIRIIRNNFNKDYTILSDNILKNLLKPIQTMTFHMCIMYGILE